MSVDCDLGNCCSSSLSSIPKDLFLFFLLLLSFISLVDREEAPKELIDRISIPLSAKD